MKKSIRAQKRFPNAKKDMQQAKVVPQTAQTLSSTYRLAFADDEFLTSDELRSLRLQLEMLKPELALAEAGIESTTVLFGGARIPSPANRDSAKTDTLAKLSAYYDEARLFAQKMTERSIASDNKEWVVCTGGGPGVMEAGNRGAAEAGGKSISLNIVLPHEQAPNEYCTPELCFNFHYFATRKIHFLLRAKAIAVFPGGFGTLDELFETLTLVQTKRMKPLPILLFGKSFWMSIVNWDAIADAGTISPEDIELFQYVESADEALAAIDAFDYDDE
ncbi:MAG: TIGR00730 family Rossman fold protein [Gammaproteobacteria bacterium]|nr:TIGR00730 family Rossman fold protein [Gammaproteobacteria bacterium]